MASNANHALLSLCLLLAVAGALAATTVADAASRRRLQRMPRIGDDDPASPPPKINNGPAEPTVVSMPPAAAACWKSILVASQDCTDDILKSLAKLEVRVGKACCSALERIGDACVAVDAFSKFPFNPLFPRFVKHVCSHAD